MICSWINDMKRIGPLDSSYIISDNTLTTFHRGMKMDELLLLNGNKKKAAPIMPDTQHRSR